VRQRRYGFGALDELDRRGVRVPRDLSLVGFDDLDFARYARVPLTTVRQPVTEQVRYAVRSLAGALHGTPLVARAITFETEFVRRRSCGCRTRSRERVLSWPLPGETQDFAGALRARQESVVANLHQAAHGGFDFVTEDWEQRLFSAFLEQVAEPEVPTFVNCVEDICYACSAGTARWAARMTCSWFCAATPLPASTIRPRGAASTTSSRRRCWWPATWRPLRRLSSGARWWLSWDSGRGDRRNAGGAQPGRAGQSCG